MLKLFENLSGYNHKLQTGFTFMFHISLFFVLLRNFVFDCGLGLWTEDAYIDIYVSFQNLKRAMIFGFPNEQSGFFSFFLRKWPVGFALIETERLQLKEEIT